MNKQLALVGGTLLAITAFAGWMSQDPIQSTPRVPMAPMVAAAPLPPKIEPAKPPKPPKIKPNFGNYKQNLIMAYHIAVDVGVPPLSIQGIMLQESRAGRHFSLINNGAYGLMQIKVNTARHVLQRTPSLTKRYFKTVRVSNVSDYEIKKLLLTSPEANIRIGCHNLAIYNNILGLGWDAAVAAYNMGIGNALKKVDTLDTNPYTLKVNSYAYTVLNEFNDKHITN